MSTNRWMDKDVVLIYNGILLSHKKEQNNAICATWMQLEIIILSEVRKRKTNTIWDHLYVESKIWHKWTYLQNRNRLIVDIENRLVVAKGEGGGRGVDWVFAISRCKLLHLEWINKVLLYSTGNYIQYPVINYNGKECLYVYNWVTLLYSRDWHNTVHQLHFNF